MSDIKKTRRISNSFYNQGLERAKIRNLTGAAESLKKSIHYNKYNIDARNLLGLIYYETGEVADALVQWVISMNLHPIGNRADHYLDEIQRKPGRLEAAAQTIKKYNQALSQAHHNNKDMAVLQLSKVVSGNPNYVKAQLLLAAAYIERGEYAKAGKGLLKVLQIDNSNPKALAYMAVVKENSGRVDTERRVFRKALSHRQMEDDDIILPPTYKENTGWQTVANIVTGLFLGAAVIFFLVMPANAKAINARNNNEILHYSESINKKNQEINSINAALDEMTARKNELEQSLSTIDSDTGNVLGQYQTLIGILQAYRKDDMQTAADLYSTLDVSLIADAGVSAIVDDIRPDMTAEGYLLLEQAGDSRQSAGDQDQALSYYEKSLLIRPDNPGIMLKQALIYKAKGDTDRSNAIFGEIINNYSGTAEAEQALAERGF